jgi:hypothetical protein
MIDDERPLPLRALADVESPEVLRAALRRFRRRTVWRVAGAILLVVALPTFLRGLSEQRHGPTEAEIRARAPSVRVDRVVKGKHTTVLLLEVTDLRELHPETADGLPPYPGTHELRIAVTATGIRKNEQLSFSTDPFTAVGINGPYIGPPVAVADGAVDFSPGYTKTIRVHILAVTGEDGGERGPGTHTREQCAIPLNPLGVCEFLKVEGRQIDVINIDVATLPLPETL